MKILTKTISLIIVFAALHVILSVLPFTITIGVSGQITLGVLSGPLIGILLGPYFGGLTVFIGSIVGMFLNPAGAIFGPLSLLPPVLGAVGAGFIRIKRGYISGALIALFVLIFYINPVGREVLTYPWFHLIAMVIAFSPVAYFAGSSFKSSKSAKHLTIGMLTAIFVGTLTDHICGSAIAIWYYTIPPEIWGSITFIYPVERIVAVIIIYFIATPLYYSLRKAGRGEVIQK